MGIDKSLVEKRQLQLANQIKEIKECLKESGIESAKIVLESQGFLGALTPVIKSFRIGKGAVQDLAEADPRNIS